MQLDYKNGGIEMIDVTCFLTSIKACWIKRFLHNREIYFGVHFTIIIYEMLVGNKFSKVK